MRQTLLVVVLVMASTAGCDAVACRDHTMYLTLDYASPSAPAADTLALDITVGSAYRHYDRPRTPGRTRDTLEVAFQSYPAGDTVAVVATATRNGQIVGTAATTQTLASRCSPLSLSLTAPGAPAGDDAGDTTDLDGGADAPDDLSSSDQVPPADLSATSTPPADLASTPVLSFTGLDDTAQSPASDMGTLYEDRCPPGAALIGFNFSAVNEIDNDKPVCARADLASTVGGGWTATWGPTTFLPYHGPNGDPGNQRLCPTNSFVVGFSGTSAVYLQSVHMVCSTIVVSQNKQVSLSADGYSMSFGPAGGSNFTIVCPSSEVATVRRERQDTNVPAYAFGLACSSIVAQ